MRKSMTNATKAAWLITALSVLMVFGLIGVPPLSGSPQPLGSAGILFVAYFSVVPWVFFWIAGDQQRQLDRIQELQGRIEELECRTTGGHG